MVILYAYIYPDNMETIAADCQRPEKLLPEVIRWIHVPLNAPTTTSCWIVVQLMMLTGSISGTILCYKTGRQTQIRNGKIQK